MPEVPLPIGRKFLTAAQELGIVTTQAEQISPVTATLERIDLVLRARDFSLTSNLLTCVMEIPDQKIILNFAVLNRLGFETLKDVVGGLDTDNIRIYSPLSPILEVHYPLLNEPAVARALRGSIFSAYESCDSDPDKTAVLSNWESCLKADLPLGQNVAIIRKTLDELEKYHPARFGPPQRRQI